MQIADAALYLRDTVPALRIVDPYELTKPQFDAAVALLRRQRPLVRRTGSTRPSRSRTSARRCGRRFELAVPGPGAAAATCLCARSCRATARRPGPTAGCLRREPRTRTARTSGSSTSRRRPSRRRRRSPSASLRRIPAPASCSRLPRPGSARSPRCRTALVHEATRLLEDARGSLRPRPRDEVRPVRRLAEGLGEDKRIGIGDGTRALRLADDRHRRRAGLEIVQREVFGRATERPCRSTRWRSTPESSTSRSGSARPTSRRPIQPRPNTTGDSHRDSRCDCPWRWLKRERRAA